MRETVKLPEISENVDSGEVIKILVSVGDIIEEEQPIIEMETEKAVFEVPSPAAGKITAIKVKEGDNVSVGQAILEIEKDGEKEEKEPEDEEKKTPEEETEKKEEIKESEEKKDAASAEEKEEPEDANEIKKDKKTEEKEESSPAEPEEKKPERLAPAAPSVRRFAREVGVDINKVKGTGPGGRISEDDVKKYVKSVLTQEEPDIVQPKKSAHIALPDFSKWGDTERKPMGGVRKVTAKNVGYSWSTIPHVTQYDKADITRIEKLRKKYGKIAEKSKGKLTITSYLIKIIELALREFPQFNASIDIENEEIIYKKYYNIGIAVDTDRGLLVPVVKNVEKKNVIELSAELTSLSEKARNKKLTPEDMEGGNITISNLGGIGGTSFSPIVLSPQVAIIGVDRAHYEAVYIEGQFEPRLMLPLSLSYDHRIIDGADGARFLRWIAEVLEEPFLAALET